MSIYEVQIPLSVQSPTISVLLTVDMQTFQRDNFNTAMQFKLYCTSNYKRKILYTFFIWNLMVALTSSIFCVMDSW